MRQWFNMNVPLNNHLNKQLVQFGIFSKNLSIDESMVPYFGNYSGKMFTRGKPIRFGYKIWVLCASTGFPYCLQLYEGKKENNNHPFGSQVVNSLLDYRQHTVYFDNFFYKLRYSALPEKTQ